MRERGARGHDVLAVVQDEQELQRPQVMEHALDGRRVRAVDDAERHRDGRCDGLGVGERDEVDEPDAVRPRPHLPRRRLESQPRLSRAAHSRQRDEAVLAKNAPELFELTLPPNERRHLRREVVALLLRRDPADLMTEDGPLELTQLVARLQPELIPSCVRARRYAASASAWRSLL